MKKSVKNALIIGFFLAVIFVNMGFVLGVVSSDDSESSDGSLKYEGYIVRFKEPSIIEEKIILEKIADENKKFVDRSSALNPIKYYTQIFSIMPEDINKETIKYSKKLLSKNEIIKNNIRDKLKKKNIVSITGNAVADADDLNVLAEWDGVLNGIALDISDEEAELIRELDEVYSVSPNLEVHAMLMDSVPLIQGGILAGQLDSDGNDCTVTGKTCLTGEGVTIGIIDTGINYTHPDLGGCTQSQFLSGTCAKVIGGYDFANNDNDPMDEFRHGTHCAGIAAGSGIGGLKGVAPNAKIYAYKVFKNSITTKRANIISAINRAIDPNQNGDFSDHLDIITMSFGVDCKGVYNLSCGPDDDLSKATDNAVNAGVIAIVAAGNSGPKEKTITSPGTSRKAITVGATYKKDYDNFLWDCSWSSYSDCGRCGADNMVSCNYWGDDNPRTNEILGFSSRGPVVYKTETINKPDIVAPGAIICSSRWDNIYPDGFFPYYKTCLDDKHVSMAGTSMATPHVAGAVALLLQINPNFSPQEIKNLLKNTAIDLGYDSNTQGSGRIDIPNILNYLYLSKITNNENSAVTGQLVMKLQKNITGVWNDVRTVTNKQITIPANSKYNLINEWNAINIFASATGNYQVYVSFQVNGAQKVEGIYKFKVS
jgi:subtilisin family serine protease